MILVSYPNASMNRRKFLEYTMTDDDPLHCSTSDASDDSDLSLCCLCGKTFPNRHLLHQHYVEDHEGDHCSSPEDATQTEAAADDSETSKYEEPETKYPNTKHFFCCYCEKVFTKGCNLNSHIKAVHKGVKSFRCTSCSKCFSRNSDLQKHVDAVHKRLRPYECSRCGKRFSQKSSLKRHLEAVHEGIKSYQCAQCDSRFSYDVHLKRHIRAKHKSCSESANSSIFGAAAAPPARV